MKEMDCVEITVEKEKYAKQGIHKGMQGWICDPRNIDNSWLVNFPQYGEQDDIATLSIKENDLILLENGMNARVNEKIKAEHECATQNEKGKKSDSNNSGDLSGYMI